MKPSQSTLDAAKAALACERETGLPAALTLAQYACESGWGNHAPGNNCFGIKAYEGCHEKQLLGTSEWFTETELKDWLHAKDGRLVVGAGSAAREDGRRRYPVKDWFATFETLEDCFRYHAQLIVHGRPYVKAWAHYQVHKNVEDLVHYLGPIYATAPTYADVLIELMRGPTIKQAMAMAAGGKTEAA